MAVYPKLLLSTGGGIISTTQQADQAAGAATLLIGLGGTGVDCIRTIKTQVYTRLKPDDPNAVIPGYEHIRFLGVDTVEKYRQGNTGGNGQDTGEKDELLSLDDTEFFSIANKNVKQAFTSTLALQQRKELDWLEYEHIEAPNLTDAGAGGIRQVGRFMMMDKSESFMNKVEAEITAAKKGLSNPRVYVHIFAGLSGGTGSGCFLDVCYMVNSIAQRIGGVKVFGYFFLPDVNLSKIPYDDTATREYIPKNGYAAMQELDYCMRLQQNGGGFEQEYQGHKMIPWKEQPVELCHLICATDHNNNVIPDAYKYAMNVTAEYVMDFLTEAGAQFDLNQHLSNFVTKVNQADAKKTFGAQTAYCVIGASCASIPLREINTYLASELFDKFSAIKVNMPRKSDVEALAVSSLAKGAQSAGGIYNAIYREIQEGFTTDYASYQDDWKYVRDYGNAELIKHYTDQTAQKLNHLESNKQSMLAQKNERALISRIQSQLKDVLKDINRGPIFAYRMLVASESHNLLNVIAGLINENQVKWDQEKAQETLRLKDYENAKSDFDKKRRRSLLDNDAKRFESYEFYLLLLEQHKLNVAVYEALDKALRELKGQIEDVTASYYVKLNRVMETLITTFEHNKNALSVSSGTQKGSSFAEPMMTIAELKDSLDAGIAAINVPGMLESFMNLLLQNEEVWIQEDENRISRLVTDFFVKSAFSNFANKTITDFLRDKYTATTGGMVTDAQLINLIYNNWMKKLTDKASPLFPFNQSVWPQSKSSMLASLSFPSISAPITSAAQQMNSTKNLWQLKPSALTDRIYVMCSACGLPLSAYNSCSEYEKMFFATKEPGRHYYEGKKSGTMKFSDWNRLPSITPRSLFDVATAPQELKDMIRETDVLYEKARKFGALDDSSRFHEPDKDAISALNRCCDVCEKIKEEADKAQDIPELQRELAAVKQAEQIKMLATAMTLPQDGFRNTTQDILRIQKDYFAASPALHEVVKEWVELIEASMLRANRIIEEAEQKMQKIKSGSNAMQDYCEAIFTGVISVEGRVIIYNRVTDGIKDPVTLSKRGEEYPFDSIPLYQGFLSYQAWEDNLKHEVNDIVNDKLNENAPEVLEVGKAMRDFLSEDRLTAWVQLAANYEQQAEIKTFLGELKRRFNTYCLENGI